MIEIRNITKRFFPCVAVNDVSLRIPRGEVLGLLGPNGAGKTTLLKLIAGFLYPDAGQIRPATSDMPTIGFKPEHLLYPGNVRVAHYLKMIARLSNVDRARVDQVVAEGLERVELERVAGQRIQSCSKGMRQRLALAQVIIGKPALMLIDEPFSGLDPEGQACVRRLIQELHEEGHTILLSSHRLYEITQVCSRLIIINRGKIRYENSMAEAMGTRPWVTVQATQDVDQIRSQLEALHPAIQVDGAKITLGEEAVDMRHQVLLAVLEAGFDVSHVEQKRTTLEEIYAEVIQ